MANAQAVRKVPVTTSPTVLTVSDNTRSAVLIRNIGASSVFLGNKDVTATTTNGWELAAGADFPDSISKGAIYGIVAAGTVDVQVWEIM